MKLKVLIPTAVLIDRLMVKVIAEAEDSHFYLLPNQSYFLAPFWLDN